MATAVQIELQVDEKGAVSGVRNVDSALKGMTPTAQHLNATLERLNQSLSQLGQKGKRAFDDTGQAAMGSLEKTRLLTEEFGVHIPRAMQRIVAESKIAQQALGAIGSAMIGLGAIQIGAMVFSQLYEGAKKLYEKWIDVDGALKTYEDEARRAAAIKLFDEGGLQTQIEMVGDLNRQIDQLSQKKENSNSFLTSFLTYWTNPFTENHGAGYSYFSPDDQKRLNELTTQRDKVQLAGIEKDYRQQVARSENRQRIAEARALPGAGRDAIVETEENRRADYLQDFTARRDRYMMSIYNRGLKPKDQKAVPANDGDAEAQEAKDAAHARRQAADIETARSNSAERIRLHNEATNAALRGDALYKAQAEQQIAEITRAGKACPEAINDVWAKYHAEEKKRLEDQERETEKMERSAQTMGLTGIARIQAEGSSREDEIRGDEKLNSSQRDRRIAAVQQQTAAQVGEEQIKWAEKVDQVIAQSQERQLSGFARIKAEAEKAAADLQRQFDAAHNRMDLGKPGAQAALDADTAKLGAGLDAITLSSDTKSADLARKNAEETERIEAEAQRKSLSADKQKTAAITVEYQERVRRLQDQLKQQEISEDDYNRRVVAAAKDRDAEMEESSRQSREKMAGEFEHLFRSLDHPMEALKDMGDKVAGEAAAWLVQKAASKKTGQATPAMPGTDEGGLFGGILGSLGLGGKKHDQPHMPAAAPHAGGAAIGGAGTIALNSAMIYVASASISLGGGAVGGASTGSEKGLTGLGLGAGPSGGGGGAAGSGASGAGGGFGSGSGAPPPQGVGVAGALNNVSEGTSLWNKAGKDFSSDSGDGSQGGWQKSTSAGAGYSSNGGLFGGDETQDNVMGAIGGAIGIYSAVEGNGGVGGTLGGAMSGMQLGMALGGPLGAAIGAAAGAVVGAVGFGGREKARVYDLKQVRPRLGNDMDAFQQGSMDYLSAYSDMEALHGEAWKTIKRMGPAADSYFKDTIVPEISTYEQKLTREQKAGRTSGTFSSAQYATGTDYVPNTEMALVHKGERILNTDQNEQITRALASGISPEAAHASYQATMQSAAARSSSGDRTLNMHIYSHDSKGVADMFREHADHIRAALSSSYSGYGGIADA